jgi:hypothetical protein
VREATGGDVAPLVPIWKAWGSEFSLMEANYDTVQGYLLLFAPTMHAHWVTDALVVLDAANLRNNALALPFDPEADACIKHGATAISEAVTAFHHHVISFRHQGATQNVSKADFQSACASFAAAGIPVREDLDQAWQAVQTERATYVDQVRKLAEMMDAPIALW